MTGLTQTPVAHCGGLLSAAPCAWDSTSTRLISASGRHVRVHGLGPPARRARSLAGHASSVVAVVTLAPARALTAGRDGVLRVWDVDDAVCLRTVDLGEQVRDVAAPAYGCPGADGRVIVACKEAVYAVHLGTATADNPARVTLWKDVGANRVACDQSGSLVCAIKEQTLFICRRIPQESDCTRADSQGNSDDDGDVRMDCIPYSVPPVHRVRHSCGLTSVAVSPEGSVVAVGCDNGEIFVYRDVSALLHNVDPKFIVQASKLAPARLHWHAGAVSALAFGGGGSTLLSGGAEAVLVVWKMSRTEFGDRSFRPRLGGAIWGISASPDDARFAITCADNAVRVLNAFSMSVEASFQGLSVPVGEGLDGRVAKRKGRELVLRNVKGMSFVPEPRAEGYVFICGVGPAVQVYDVVRGEHVAFLPVVPRNIVHVAGTGSERAEVPRQPKVEFVCLSRDAELMATIDSQELFSIAAGSESAAAVQVLRFWRRNPDGGMEMLARVDRPHGPHGQVCAIEFHPNLPVLATSSLSGDFKLWRMAATGVPARPLTWRCEVVGEHRGLPCGPIAFSADGSLLAVANASTISLWHIYSARTGGEDGDNTSDESVPIYDGCVTESSPRSLNMQIVHTFVHPPAEEHIRDLKFMGADGPFIVAITEHGVYVWHVLGQCIWWTIRLLTLGKPITVDYQSNRFAVGIELFSADDGSHTASNLKPSLNGEDETQGTVHAGNGYGSMDGQTRDLDRHNSIEDGSSWPTGAGRVVSGPANSDKKLQKRSKGNVGDQNDAAGYEPRKCSSNGVVSLAASGQGSSPMSHGERLFGRTNGETGHHEASEEDREALPIEQGLNSPELPKTASGPSSKKVSSKKMSKLLSSTSSGRASSRSRTETAFVMFDVSSPVPLCVHRLRNQAKLLAVSFVRAPPSFCSNGSCPLVLIDSNLDVHMITTGTPIDEGSAVTATGKSEASTGEDRSVQNERQHNLDDLLGADWRERVSSSQPAMRGRYVMNGGIAGPTSSDGEDTWRQSPCELNDVESTIAKAFAGPTHALAPVSATCPELIRSFFSSPLLPTLGLRKADDAADPAGGTALASGARDIGDAEAEDQRLGLMSMDSSGWHYENGPANHRGSNTEDSCSARLLRFAKLFANFDFAHGATSLGK